MPIKKIKAAQPVTEEDIQQLQKTVAEIVKRVKEEGDAALRAYEKEFDNFEPESFLVTPDQAAKAKDVLPAEIIEELDFAMDQVRAFAEAQKACMREQEVEIMPGLTMGHRIIPVKSCACYVPAGRYPCLTSAVMSVTPAKVAGVERVIACSPPGPDGGINPGILYTMHKMGVDEIYCMGGAQAIAAFAYGTQTIKPVNLIVGPGNRFVQEAKRQVFGTCGIDFLAGPSEVMVIADEHATPAFVAADLLAQCEHDPNARAALVTTSERLLYATLKEIETQLRSLETEAVARSSWENKGEAVLCDSLEECAGYANEYAPEHLEVHVQKPKDLLPMLSSYGSLFLGELTAEVYADKIAGTNHILPTGAAAKYTGGLWVGMFLKVITHQEADLSASLKLARYTEAQSKFEKMDAHRYAAAIRLQRLT
jgi:sulfopropanediol 3-dehydrogenase